MLRKEEIKLCYASKSIGFKEAGVPQRVFGELVRKAITASDCKSGPLQHYLSDLYHDADFISQFEFPGTFWWGFDEWGTIFTTDEEMVEAYAAHRINFYQVSVTSDRGRWVLTLYSQPSGRTVPWMATA